MRSKDDDLNNPLHAVFCCDLVSPEVISVHGGPQLKKISGSEKERKKEKKTTLIHKRL